MNSLSGYINGESAEVEVRTERIAATDVNVSVYPNPVNNMLNVFVSENAQIELSDLSGRVIMTVNNVLADQKQELNVAGVADGVYMLKVWNGEFVSTSKVVVKH
ncbi:MAG: T9SS type A sorting domain-containing protein [Bacteroidetes bacterium]|nr:T9SS type A sorting domain-containing protein [Bacteroidota bacterium]